MCHGKWPGRRYGWRCYRVMFILLFIFGGALWSTLIAAELPYEKQELVIGEVSGDIGTIDPFFITQMNDFPVAEMVFSGLVKYSYDKPMLEFEPDLAKSWETSKDGKLWKFYLREGVQWHKGYGEVTSEDVVFSLKKAMNHSMYSPQYKKSINNITSSGKYIVEIELNTPDPYFLALVMNWGGGFVFCKKAIGDVLGEKAVSSLQFRLSTDPKQVVGSGPFIFQEHIPGQASILVANTKYFRGSPKLKKVTVRYIPSFKTLDFALRSGDVDIAPGARISEWANEMRNLGFVLDFNLPVSFYPLWMNQNVKPLGDIRVRRAIAHAINKGEIVEIMGGRNTRKGCQEHFSVEFRGLYY